jgi:hypothetical protein
MLPAVSEGVPEAFADTWWAKDVAADTYMAECEQQLEQEELAAAMCFLAYEA